jgi:hypothetical protein
MVLAYCPNRWRQVLVKVRQVHVATWGMEQADLRAGMRVLEIWSGGYNAVPRRPGRA